MNERYDSAVSWPAILTGAVGSAALGLSLLALSAGAGLSSISPWSNSGASAAELGTGAICAMIAIAIIASSLGGYITGRLRTKWTGVHSHEVYFRDTAHGFLAWSAAFVITAAFLGTASTALVGHAGQGAMTAAGETGGNKYFVDQLFRSQQIPGAPDSLGHADHADVAPIVAHALSERTLGAEDKTYLSGLVASRTGLSTADADRRVTDVMAKAQKAADDARKAVAHSLYWIFVGLLVGAFSASLAATIGGRVRDNMPAI